MSRHILSAAKDELFRSDTPEQFQFDERVVEVFDDMILRSVPHYIEVQETTAELADKFVRPDTTIYDLGCSTGTTILTVSKRLSGPNYRIIGVDNSQAMLTRCREKLSSQGIRNVEFLCQDLLDVKIENSSFVSLNYTLQFVPVPSRLKILSNIRLGLIDGGALVLTEKIIYEEKSVNALMTDLYHSFKIRNGYSELEISRKREALEDVLVPLTLEENMELLKRAGFSVIEVFLKRYNFASILAF